ncbi:MAG TPA: BTAD domain-containing putative transcriptional regulator [Actinocrinis sp.]|nr:BTAD domain-containing putative transcriptional regulator [Actinocrinis sp.]
MFFRVLGPVGIDGDGSRLSLGTAKEQAVLAILLLEAGRVVSAQSLAERLWDDRMPAKARETLQAYVSRLRGRLRAAGDMTGMIVRSPAGGYRLNAGAEQVDVRLFEALVSRARSAAADRAPGRAVELLREAEALWLGEPLEGLDGLWVQTMRDALLEKRRAARLARINLQVQTGVGDGTVLGELAELTAGETVDQRAVELQMTALEREGRQHEALAVYERVRRRLLHDMAIEPRPQLQALHVRILRGERQQAHAPTGLTGAFTAGAAQNTLDRVPAHFSGRDELARAIIEQVRADAQANAGIAVYALDGMAGVGKSALAVYCAHQLAGDFPGGLLQVNFRAHDPRRAALDVPGALTQLLDAISVPAGEIDTAQSRGELADLWRRRSSGRSLLLVLDDIAAFEDIDPLVPVSAGSVVLLTSRRRLSGLVGCRHYTVEPLTDEASVRLLERATGRSFSDDRETVRFVALSGGVPLAVVVAAAHLQGRPAWGVADLVERMSTSSGIDDAFTGPVTSALAMSYRDLSASCRVLLRQVAALPGRDFGLHAACAAYGSAPGEADRDLDCLVENHLVEETVRWRYRLHDLVRAFALEQTGREEDAHGIRESAERAAQYYIATAARAENMLRPERRAAWRRLDPAWSEPHFADRDAAYAWLNTENSTLQLLALARNGDSDREIAVALGGILAKYLDRTGRWHQAVTILERAVQAAGTISCSAEERSDLLSDLAAAYVRTGRFQEVLLHARTAVQQFAAHDDVRGQADALLQIGRALCRIGQLEQADDVLDQSARFYQQVGNDHGVCVAHVQKARVLFQIGRHRAAIDAAVRAVDAAENRDDMPLACDALTNVGEMYRRLGDGPQALAYYRRAMPLAEQLGDPHNLAALTCNIAFVQATCGEGERAVAAITGALRLLQALDDRSGQVEAHLGLAEAHRALGRFDQAGDDIDNAAALSASTDLLGQWQVAMARGRLLVDLSDPSGARTAFQAAADHARQAEAPLELANASRALAAVYDP